MNVALDDNLPEPTRQVHQTQYTTVTELRQVHMITIHRASGGWVGKFTHHPTLESRWGNAPPS